MVAATTLAERWKTRCAAFQFKFYLMLTSPLHTPNISLSRPRGPRGLVETRCRQDGPKSSYEMSSSGDTIIGSASTTHVAPSAICRSCFSAPKRWISLSDASACSQLTVACLSPKKWRATRVAKPLAPIAYMYLRPCLRNVSLLSSAPMLGVYHGRRGSARCALTGRG